MTETGPGLRFDEASAISMGARDYQEDAIITDFTRGAGGGFAVLADGMGGHAAGDLASKIVVTEVFSGLVFRRGDIEADPGQVAGVLTETAMAANDCLKAHVAGHPDTAGMGATLVSVLIRGEDLYWLSIGDSPLFLFRDNRLVQLNEDHSLAPLIDQMVATGALTEAQGRAHPDRNSLTSVLIGEEIAQIDCPRAPVRLRAGDVLILASDGLQFLDDETIEQTLRERPFSRSAELADALMAEIEALADPDQDNVSLSVIRVMNAEERPARSMRKAGASAISVLRWPFREKAADAAARTGHGAARGKVGLAGGHD